MCGPELTFDRGGNWLLRISSSKHQVYWSTLAAGAEAFTLHVATPTQGPDEIYPCAVSNGRGEVLMLWQVGPMAVGQKARVHWAMYQADGTYTGRTAELGVTTSGTKATAFADAKGDFHVLTTAR